MCPYTYHSVRAAESSTAYTLSLSAYIKATNASAVALTAQKSAALRRVPFLYTADQKHLEALALALRPVNLRGGDTLTQHLVEGVVYFLVSGELPYALAI